MSKEGKSAAGFVQNGGESRHFRRGEPQSDARFRFIAR